ncbi:low-density lipoprotein receptor-related protein 2-like [Liolophura sinensis]|uniref:low-density lipoprotein receptor-related protein 2-like n=1 Tax=Liolophura sinensis TaxID=3198878 RepID=UPI003158F714
MFLSSFLECAGYGVGHSACPSVHLCTAPCGFLASANYPANYPNQHTCRWHIKLSPGKYVALQILHFDILNKHGDCSSDYLEIEDVDVSGRMSSLGRFCTDARVPEGVFYSSKNEMYLTFVSDKSIAASGFLVSYTEYLYNVSADIYSKWKQDSLNDKRREGHHEWSDGSQLTFTDWYVSEERTKASQPNGGEQEDCGVIILGNIQSTAYWHDIACANDDVSQFICEKPITDRVVDGVDVCLAPEYTWSNVSVCLSGQYRCQNGECISALFQCDKMPDCSDGSDELKCGTECGPLSFTCDNGDCISISFYCDFKADCADRSDEATCARRRCDPDEFRCDNGQCVPGDQVCDIQTNCQDGSDERDCST